LTSAADQQLLQTGGVQGAHLGPELGLRGLQERADPRREERALDIPLRVRASKHGVK
jgi:hypothetical protein